MAIPFESFKNKKVLVTGHTGFKGSWLSLWLAHLGACVVGVGLAPSSAKDHFNLLNLSSLTQSHFVDIRDLKALREIFKSHSFDFVFHLAAQAFVSKAYEDRLFTYTTNVMGTVHVLECIKEFQVPHSVIITSDKAYKNTEQMWSYRENDVLAGIDPYSASKSAADIITSSYIQSIVATSYQGLAIARAGNVIGGGDWGKNRIIPDIITSLEKDEVISIRSPEATRPWQHVLEPLRGYLQLALKLSSDKVAFSQAFNFGPRGPIFHRVESVVKKAIELYGKCNYIIKKESIGYESSLLSIDITKATFLLDWQPFLSFEETMEMTIDWYKRYQKDNVLKLSTQQIEDYMSYETK